MRADGTEFPAELTVTRTGLPGEPIFTAYVRDITDRQRAEKELIASRARLVTASDAARQRVTRDLHDGAQQRLVATLINLQLAEQRWDSAPHRARELLSQALMDARRGIEDLRELASGLHPAVLSQHGLAPAVRALADRVPIPVEIDVPAIRLPAPIEGSLYFFCSEALTNIVKHAQATCAWVRLEVVTDQYVVEVRDDGIGGARPRLGDQRPHRAERPDRRAQRNAGHHQPALARNGAPGRGADPGRYRAAGGPSAVTRYTAAEQVRQVGRRELLLGHERVGVAAPEDLGGNGPGIGGSEHNPG